MRSSLVGVLVCASCGHANSEGAKFCEECGFSFAVALAGTKEQRKTVTVLFCDVTGSTALSEALDPERLRTLLARYFGRMKGIVESHGGSVEKFIGDAVMAVFGVPAVHEDDALRACRAAVEMREALRRARNRGADRRDDWRGGDGDAGAAGDRRCGECGRAVGAGGGAGRGADRAATLALVGDGVEVEPLEPLELKGKAEPVACLPAAVGARRRAERRREARFVGRERELMLVREVWERAAGEAAL